MLSVNFIEKWFCNSIVVMYIMMFIYIVKSGF